MQGEAATLRTEADGSILFTAFPAMRDEGGDVAVVVRASNGETSEGGYRLTPAAPNPAYPNLRQFSLTNLRPRLLGAGDDRYTPPPPSGEALASGDLERACTSLAPSTVLELEQSGELWVTARPGGASSS